MSVGFGFLKVFNFDRWTVAELIGRFRAQSFTSASHPRERIDHPEPLNGIQAGHVGVQDYPPSSVRCCLRIFPGAMSLTMSLAANVFKVLVVGTLPSEVLPAF